MTTRAVPGIRRPAVPLLLGAFAAAVALRVELGGSDPAGSAAAGLAFAAALAAAALAAGSHTVVTWRACAVGILGAALLVVPVGMVADGAARPSGSYLGWAAVVAVVAGAEEALLRGALYDAVRDAWGESAAIVVGALAFAALHVPLYGWPAAPLDAGAGLVLGVLRKEAGTWTAPALAHVLADLSAWWLR